MGPCRASPVTAYTVLPLFYDRFMDHVDYGAWIDFSLAATGLAPPALLLDLACGSGTISVGLARRGFSVIGIDRSPEMLAQADQKAREAGVSAVWSCQDLTAFETGSLADGAVCLFDSLNYLTGDGELLAAFRRVAAALKSGAPFLFDLHTEARFRRFAEEGFFEIDEDAAYIWTSEYDAGRRICMMELTLFAKESGSQLYARYDELHVERAYDDAEVRKALTEAGFRLERTYGELRQEPPGPDEERIFYLARKS